MTWHPDMPLEFRDSIVTGDARVLAARIPDGSMDLVFCDPVYDRIEDYRWLAETASRVLRAGGALLAFCGIGYQRETQEALMVGGRPVRWILPVVYSPPNRHRFHPKGFAGWAMLLWAGGEPTEHFCDVHVGRAEENVSGHGWTKNEGPIRKYLRAFSEPGAVALDPFTGGGTVPAVCKQLGRRFVAFEIDPATAEKARRRVRDTPMPLPFEEPLRQVELPLESAA